MAISTYASYKAKVLAPWLHVVNQKSAIGAVAQFGHSTWLLAQDVGAAPTTAAVPTKDTAGALMYPRLYNSAGTLRLARVDANMSLPGTWWLCDRLSHQGGLSGTVTTPQTTNLATAALTRYTSGVGVMMALEIYTVIGTTGTTVTVSYTNTADTAGQITPAIAFGATGFREASRFILLPLASGDLGVKSVQSVTVLATTGTAGNFGVTLFKPIFPFSHTFGGSATSPSYDGLLTLGGVLPEIVDNACLWWFAGTGTGGTGDITFTMSFIED